MLRNKKQETRNKKQETRKKIKGKTQLVPITQVLEKLYSDAEELSQNPKT